MLLLTALLLSTGPIQEPGPSRGPDVRHSNLAQSVPARPTRRGAVSGETVRRIFSQVYPNWTPTCDAAGVAGHRIAFDLTLDGDGRIVAGPTLVRPQDGAGWRAAAETARQALLRSTPFDVPPGFSGGEYRPTFRTDRVCAHDEAPQPDEP